MLTLSESSNQVATPPLQPLLKVHMLARDGKGRWKGQELKVDCGKGKRAKGVPYIKEVDVEMFLQHRVVLTINGTIARDDTHILERLNEQWCDANMPGKCFYL